MVRSTTLRRSAWLDRVALIPQDPYLFHATLREKHRVLPP